MKINPQKPLDPTRDRLIFSKAHDCKALYAVLAEKSFFNSEKLKTYEMDGGLPGHSTRNIVPGIEASAGSLGHGLSIAAGIAYAKKLDKKLQAYGRISEVLELDPFTDKWKAFGWEVREVDGHSIDRIESILISLPFRKGKPSVLLAHTIKGYLGVEKYVDHVSSQYKPPTKEEYEKVLEDIK